MTHDHRAVTILPCTDIDASQAFYRLLGFEPISDYGDYRILADGRGWHLHLNRCDSALLRPPHNPIGIYLYVDDVDAVADSVRDRIIEKGALHVKPWGTYEFAISDPDGVLVRVGRPVTAR